MKAIDKWPYVRRTDTGRWEIEMEDGASFTLCEATESDSDVVYLIQAPGGPVKIGLSTRANVDDRLCDLQVGNPYKLEIKRLFAGGRPTEQILHVAFGRARIRGEWFLPTKPLEELLPRGHYLGSEPYLSSYRDGYEKGYAEGKKIGWSEGWEVASNRVSQALGLDTCPTLAQEAA